MMRFSITLSLVFLSGLVNAAGDYCAVSMKAGQPVGEVKDIGGGKRALFHTHTIQQKILEDFPLDVLPSLQFGLQAIDRISNEEAKLIVELS
jgi:hypothetical protein